MAGRKVQDKAEAIALLEEARTRGVKPSQVALKLGIDGRSLHAWSMTLARTGRLPTTGTLLELVAVEPNKATAAYRVVVGDLVVEVPDSFESGTLQRLVRSLRAC